MSPSGNGDWFTPLTRRSALKRLGIGAAISLGVTGVTSEHAQAINEPVGENQSFTKDDGIRISMDDGKRLAATLYEPDSGTPAPVVLIRPGGLATRFLVEDDAEFWANNGYVVLVYSPRGIGDSEGLADPWSDTDTEDSRTIIDWLADRDSVQAAGRNPVLGMHGSSGGGIQQFRTAAVDDRVDALIPRATPRDFGNTNDDDVFPWAWIYFAYLQFLRPQANVDPRVLELWNTMIEKRELTDEWLAYYADRLPVREADRVATPTLLIHSWRDRAFKPNKAFMNYRGLSEASERRLIMSKGGAHNFLDTTPTAHETAFISKARLHWMDKHLRGKTPPEDSPVSETARPIHFYHSQEDSFESYSSFPSGNQIFALRDSSNHGEGTTSLKTVGDGAPHGTWFDFPIEKPLELAGVGSLSLTATPTRGEPHLFAALADVAPDGASTLIGTQIAEMEIASGGQTTVEFDLIGVRHTVNSDHTLRLHLTLDDDELAGLEPLANQADPPLKTAFIDGLYVDSAPPAGLVIHHTRGQNSTLQVTTRN